VDARRVGAVLTEAEAALKKAREIYQQTDWPTAADYDIG
jgi:hypothetical protein